MDNNILSKLFAIEDQNKWPLSWTLSQEFNVSHDEIVSAIKSLESKNYLKLTPFSQSKFIVTKEGLKYAIEGTKIRTGLVDSAARR